MDLRAVYLCWPPSEITGGIKLTFRHVEILRQLGLDAVVASEDATQPTWFDTNAPCIPLREVDPVRDVLVFPENHVQLLTDFADWPNKKIIYCQNQFMAHVGLGGRSSYSDFGISEVLALGKAATNFCKLRFEDLEVYELPAFVDESLFPFCSDKELKIAFAPRKRQLEANFIFDLVQANSKYSQIPWVAIDGESEHEVATILERSALYLSLQRLESVGMSALEAMSCGCTVVGFAGIGGLEYASPQNGFWVPEDDCVQCALKLTEAIDLIMLGDSSHASLVKNSVLTARRYGQQPLVTALKDFWLPRLRGN